MCSALGPVFPGREGSHPVRPRQWVGEIRVGKMGLVPMKPYRGGPSHLSPRFLPIRADGLQGRNHSVPSLGNASPSIILGACVPGGEASVGKQKEGT